MISRNLFANDSARPSPDSKAQSFCEKYRPMKISGFVGLERAKTILQKFAAHPYSKAWLFIGPTGIGKTSMALALASEADAELHHLGPTCTREDIERVWKNCQGFPTSGFKRHLILVDDVDCISKTTLNKLLAKLDAHDNARDMIWVFTCTETEKLGRRFLSFFGEIKFSSYGIAKEAAALLERVWQVEGGPATAITPNFARIVKESNNDVRAALNTLELELMTKREVVKTDVNDSQ
jgi:replication-associated recombination protein RarA